jgi:hypothetical protein
MIGDPAEDRGERGCCALNAGKIGEYHCGRALVVIAFIRYRSDRRGSRCGLIFRLTRARENKAVVYDLLFKALRRLL